MNIFVKIHAIFFFAVICLMSKAQTYVALSHNFGDGSLVQNSYPAIEIGRSFQDLSVGLCMGRANMNFSETEKFSHWFSEIRFQYNIEMKPTWDAYFGFGFGTYIENNNVFTEFDLGVMKSFSKIDIFSGLARFDEANYFQLGIAKMISR